MPRLTMSRASLHPALSTIDSIIEAKNTIPVLSHVRLALAGGALTLSGTDLDIEISTTRESALEAEGEGTLCLPSKTLREVVGKLPEGQDITIEWDKPGEQASVKAGRSRFKLPSLPPEDFPDVPAQEYPFAMALPAAQLAALFARVSFAISAEETRYYLNGIFMHQDEAFMAFVATDGHRLAKALYGLVLEGSGTPPAVIIPRKTVAEVIKLGKASKDTIRVEWSQVSIRFTLGTTVLTSKLIDGTFPDYARVIPRANPERATLGVEDLAQALARVTTVSGDKGRAARFTFDRARLVLEASSDTGAAEEEVEAAFTGNTLTMGFNAAYLTEALRALGSEKATLALKTPGDSTLITTPEDESFLTVLMPMRV